MGLWLVSCSWLAGQSLKVSTLKVSVQAGPVGSMAQIRLDLERPVPLATGRFRIELPAEVFGAIEDVQVFSPVGDAMGTVSLGGNRAEVWFRSSSASVGRVNGMPVATVLAPLKTRQERAWAKVTITEEWKPATTAEPWMPQVAIEPMGELGTVTVSSVVPVSDTTYRVTGTGFTAETKVEAAGVPVTTVTWRSATEVEFAVAGPVELTGRVLRVEGVEWVYALETVWQPTTPPAGAVPMRLLAPLRGQVSADLGLSLPPARWRYGLTVVNPHAAPVEMTIDMLDAAAGLVQRRTQMLPARGRFDSEFGFGFEVPFRSVVGLTFSRPVRVVTSRRDLGLPEIFLAEPSPYQAVAEPEVTVSAAALDMQVTLGGKADEGELGVTTVRSLAPLTYRAEADVPWLLLTQSSDSSRTMVKVRPAAGLAVGEYRGNVRLIASGASVTSRVIPVTLRVQPGSYFELAPEVAVFASVDRPQGGSAVPYRRAPASPAPLTMRTEIEGGLRWLTAIAPNDPSGDGVGLAVDATGLTPGVYVAKVTATGAANSQTTVVRLTVTEYGPPFILSRSALESVFEEGNARPETVSVQMSSRIGPGFSVRVVEGEGWLTAGEALNQFLSLQVTVDPQRLTAGDYRGRIVVTDGTRSATLTVRVKVWRGETGELTVRVTPPANEFSGAFELEAEIAGDSLPVNVWVDESTPECRAGVSLISPTAWSPARFRVEASGAGFCVGTLMAKAGTRGVYLPFRMSLPPFEAAKAPTAVGLVTHAATNGPGPVAPGSLMTIYGPGVRREVRFDGVPGVVTYESWSQVNVAVPASVAGKRSVVMRVNDVAETVLAVASSSPGLFTADGTGRGQAAVFNADGYVNGAEHPAAVGSVVKLYGTGIVGEVTVTMGGAKAEVRTAGPVGNGLYVMEVAVPAGVRGVVRVRVAAGGAESPAGVTIVVE